MMSKLVPVLTNNISKGLYKHIRTGRLYNVHSIWIRNLETRACNINFMILMNKYS
jgi:hypothetical protein